MLRTVWWLVALLVGWCLFTPAQAAPVSWTILVYLDANNDLEQAGISDFNQMEAASSSPDVNVVVQIDRVKFPPGTPSDDTSNGDWEDTRRYFVTQDTDLQIIHSMRVDDPPLGELNMGDPQTLVDFVQWGIRTYPAEHYAVILWDHGNGWKALTENLPTKSICLDTTSSDRITTDELMAAFAAIRSTPELGRNLDLVACDACIMGDLELAYPLRQYVDYYVSSEENVPFWGLPYNDWLTRLAARPTMSAAETCRELVNTYRASYNHGSQGYWLATLSAIDLSHMSEVAAALSTLADELRNAIAVVPFFPEQLHTWWELAEVYSDPVQIDLGYFADLVRQEGPTLSMRTAAENLLAAYQSSIVANGLVSYYPEARTGLSLYYPFGNTLPGLYLTLALAADTTWDEFLAVAPDSTGYVSDLFEVDNTQAQAKPVTLGVSHGRHWFHVVGDVDMGSFAAEEGKQYFIATEHNGPECDTQLSLLAPDGAVLATDDEVNTDTSQIIWTCPASGVYTASVQQSLTGYRWDSFGSKTAYDLFISRITFSDVSPDYWAFKSIEACAQTNIVQGYWNGYHPKESVNRAQMAVFVARSVAPEGDRPDLNSYTPPATPSFIDVAPDYWAYKFIEYCKEQNLVQGYWDGYHPGEMMNRSQMAVYIARAIAPPEARPDLPSYTPPALPTFFDIAADYWAYKYIEYCSEYGVVQGYTDGTYQPDLIVTREQMAVYIARAFSLP